MSRNGEIDGNSEARPKPVANDKPSLPRRFYKSVTVAPPSEGQPGGFRVLLDSRPVRTPMKQVFEVATPELAEAIAAEWQAQGTHVDPRAMPLTRLVNSALDGVRGRENEVAQDIVKYAGSDLLCYRAESPAGLVDKQAHHWDPVLAWANEALAAPFVTAKGVVHVSQEPAALQRLADRLAKASALQLAALHVITTLTGSALLACAALDGRLDADALWAAAHVDEDWQISQWGEDQEAAERRRARRAEFDAAYRILSLERPT